MKLIIIFYLLFLIIIKSDFPFHLLTHPLKLLNDQDYLLSSAQFAGLSGWVGDVGQACHSGCAALWK
jgi:hypothetical protein